MLSEGTEIGSYRILRLLGSQGGMSAGYLAEHIRTGGKRALKQFDKSVHPEFEEGAIYQEARVLDSLDHPNIVRVTDLFEARDSVFLVMDYIDGKNVRQSTEEEFQKPRGGIGEYHVGEVGIKISSALEYLHRQNPPVVHRDIKPDNIICREKDGNIFLVDFGIASLANDPYQRESIGTPPFVAPEQHTREACPKSDVYALSGTLYYILSGEEPNHDADKFLMQIEDRWKSHNMSRGMCDVLTRSAQPSTCDRYNSSEMFHHLSMLKDYTKIPNHLVDNVVRPNLSETAKHLIDTGCESVIIKDKDHSERYTARLVRARKEPWNSNNKEIIYKLYIKKKFRRSMLGILREMWLDPQEFPIQNTVPIEIIHTELYPFNDQVVVSYVSRDSNGFKHEETNVPIK